MPTWIRFKTASKDEVVCQLKGGSKASDGEVRGWELDGSIWKVHPDDADRVWEQLCAMCEPQSATTG